ncbi:MAG: ATP-binding protein [bacterium]
MDKKAWLLINIRWTMIVAVNVVVWLTVMIEKQTIPWAAYFIGTGVTILSNLTAIALVKRKKWLREVCFCTLLVDILVHLLTIHYTDGVQSPFYLASFITVIVTSIVLSLPASVIIATIFSILYGLLIFLDYTGTLESKSFFSSQDISKTFASSLVIDRILVLYIIAITSGYIVRQKDKVSEQLAGYLKKETENIIENMEGGLLTIDADGRITTINKRACEIIGLSEDVEERFITEVLPESKKSVVEILIKTLKNGKKIRNKKITLVENAGRKILLEVNTSLLCDGAGNIVGAIGIFNDITQISELEERTRLSERLADIGMIAAKFGHEVGNSLVGIRLFTENLSEELNPDDSKHRYTRKILSEVNNLTNKITQLKDFSKPLSLELIQTDVNNLLKNTLLVAEAGKNTKIKIERELTPDLPKIELDYNQMKGAFLNIILNSIQAMSNGGTLKVSTTLLSLDDEKDSYIKVVISDTGSGIPKSIQDKIFTPFFTTKNGIGTGLGLAIVHKIITSHGGEIYFESEERKGTSFTVLLPFKVEDKG